MNTYFHKCTDLGNGAYQISWVVERWSAIHGRSGQAFYSRETALAGANRFCSKHGCELPA